jgi:hypothetical protein
MGTNGIQDAAQLSCPVGGLDGLDHGIVGVVLTEPHGPPIRGLPVTAPAGTLPSSGVTGPGVLPLSTSGRFLTRSWIVAVTAETQKSRL